MITNTWNQWVVHMESVGCTHGISGLYTWNQWVVHMESVGCTHGISGLYTWNQWVVHMESVGCTLNTLKSSNGLHFTDVNLNLI